MWSPQQWGWWWLDKLLSIYCGWVFCSNCGCWRWDSPCYAAPHWRQKRKKPLHRKVERLDSPPE